MVKLKGPLLGQNATGQIGGALVFANWKGRATLRQLVKPAQPKSGLQVSMRAMMSFCGRHWSQIIPVVQATWEDQAAAKGISRFNAYTSVALDRWRRFLAPFDSGNFTTYPADGTLDTFTATGGVRQITLAWTWEDKYEMVGLIIHRKATSGEAATLTNVVYLPDTPVEENGSWIDTPLDPGTYYYDVRTIGTGGVFSAVQKSTSATCT